MKDERLKLKNIRDLEYNHILDKQNISLILIGTAIISISINSELFPENLSKMGSISALILFMFLIILFYSKKLEKKVDEIKNI